MRALESARLVLAQKTRSYVGAAKELAEALLEVHAELEAERWRRLEAEAALRRLDPSRAASPPP